MQNLVAWGSTQTVMDDSGATPSVQAQPSALELQNGLQIIHHFGFSSSAPKGSRFLAIYGGGDRTKGTILGTINAMFRRTGLAEGETVIHDMWGNEVHLAQSGITVKHAALVTIAAPQMVVNAPTSVTVNAPEVTVVASTSVTVTSPLVCVEGALDVTGEVKAMCDGAFVTLSKHKGHMGTASPTPGT